MPPPGTRPDELPPSIREIKPAPDSVAVGFGGRLQLRFDEPVRIPNEIGRQLFASPMEVYDVKMGFSNLSLRPVNGWRDSTVYCYKIPTRSIADLLRNRMEGDAEFCFSTGAEIAEPPVAGSVTDMITQMPLEGARVIFWAGPDSVPFGAVTDSTGRFVARGLPDGEYEAFAFVDTNGNLVPDRRVETHDSVEVAASGDTLQELAFVIVPPDTTPPRLGLAEGIDSVTVELAFDDYLVNPQPEPVGIVIRDSLGAPVEVAWVEVGRAQAVAQAVAEGRLEVGGGAAAEADSAAAAADSTAAGEGEGAAAAPDSAAAGEGAAEGAEGAAATPDSAVAGAGEAAAPDSAVTTPDSAAAGEAAEAAAEGAAATPDSVAASPDSAEAEVVRPPLPAQYLTAKLAAPVAPGQYVVSVARAVNIRQLAGGGDTVFVLSAPPEAPDSTAVGDSTGVAADSGAVAAQDSAGVAADTTGATPDTAGAPPDTTGAPPDTTSAPPDTTGAPPDTTSAPPDTTGAPPDSAGAPPDTAGAPPDTTSTPPDTTGPPPDTTSAPPDTAATGGAVIAASGATAPRQDGADAVSGAVRGLSVGLRAPLDRRAPVDIVPPPRSTPFREPGAPTWELPK